MAVLVLLFVIVLVVLGHLSRICGAIVSDPLAVSVTEPEKVATGDANPRTLFFNGETRMEDCNCKLVTLAFAALLKPVAFEEMDGLRETGSKLELSTS